jgi:hypothetical protein
LSGSGANLLQVSPTYASVASKKAKRVSTFYIPTSADVEEDFGTDLVSVNRKSKSNLINSANAATTAEKRMSTLSTRRPTVKPLGRGMTLTEKENGELEIKISVRSATQMEPPSISLENLPETIPLSEDSHSSSVASNDHLQVDLINILNMQDGMLDTSIYCAL